MNVTVHPREYSERVQIGNFSVQYNNFLQKMLSNFKILLLVLGISLLTAPTLCEKWEKHKWNSEKEKERDLGVLQEQIFFVEQDKSYYYYKVYSDKGKINVWILHSDLTSHTLQFKKSNKLYFRDAYDRYIILQEKNWKGSVSYWVLQIVHTSHGHVLQSFAVDSIEDFQGFKFNNTYTLTEIIEYDEKNKLMYVVLDSKTNFNVNEIDLKKKYNNKMKIVNWFIYSIKKRENIVGGNSRVLVQATNDQLWIDTRNKLYTFTTETIYKKYNIEDLTALKIYAQESIAYNFISSYFQYVSLSKDHLCMTAFVYHGYTKSKLEGVGTLRSSKKPIKFYSDDQSYFVAVADNDLYFTLVQWNQTISDYTVYSRTLRKSAKDSSKWPQYIKSFTESLLIVQYNLKFFILTEDTFYVENEFMMEKIKLEKKITKYDNLEEIMFKYMKKYLKEGKSNKH